MYFVYSESLCNIKLAQYHIGWCCEFFLLIPQLLRLDENYYNYNLRIIAIKHVVVFF